MADMTVAIGLVNTMHQELVGLVQAIIAATASGGISPLAGLAIGTEAMQLGVHVVGLLQASDPQLQAQVLDVLEHGYWTMPPQPHAAP